MRWSKHLRAAAVVVTTVALLGVPVEAAFAKPHGTFTLNPDTVPPGTSSTVDVQFTPSQGATQGPSGDNLQCMILTEDGFSNTVLADPPTNLDGWTASVSGADQNIVQAQSDGTDAHQLHKGQLFDMPVTVTAPSTQTTYTWTLDTYRTADCGRSGFSFEITASITVGPPPGMNLTSTTLVCDSGTPYVNAADACHVTVTDIGGNNPVSAPTGTVDLSNNPAASGSFDSASCTLANPTADAATCDANFTGTVLGAVTLTATYEGDSTHVGSVGNYGLTVIPPPPPGKNSTTTTLSCTTGTPFTGVADPCTATVKDLGDNVAATAPTGTVDLTTSGGGAWDAPMSCDLSAASADSSTCSLNYTANVSGVNETLTATYGGDDAHTGSVGTTTINAQAKSIPFPGKPDLVIRRQVSGAKWVGENIYSGTGTNERVRSFVKQGHTVGAYVKIENDANHADIIVVGGRADQAGFHATYWFGTKNITNKVAGHGYAFALKAHGMRVIRIEVHAFATAAHGKERTWQILGRSTNQPLKRDAVKFQTIVS